MERSWFGIWATKQNIVFAIERLNYISTAEKGFGYVMNAIICRGESIRKEN
jgi:hypothetical protein